MLCRQSTYNYKEGDIINSTLCDKTCEDKKRLCQLSSFPRVKSINWSLWRRGQTCICRLCRQRRSEIDTSSSRNEQENTNSHATGEKISDDTNEKWWSRERLTTRVSVHSSTGVLIARYFKSDRKLPCRKLRTRKVSLLGEDRWIDRDVFSRIRKYIRSRKRPQSITTSRRDATKIESFYLVTTAWMLRQKRAKRWIISKQFGIILS